MKLAVCQMALSENIKNNAAQIIHFMEKASRQEVELICFPEMSLTGYTPALLSKSELNLIVEEILWQIAKKCDDLHLGAIIGYGYREGTNLFNRAGVILPGGKQFTYDKIYLTEVEEKYFHHVGNLVFPFGAPGLG